MVSSPSMSMESRLAKLAELLVTSDSDLLRQDAVRHASTALSSMLRALAHGLPDQPGNLRWPQIVTTPGLCMNQWPAFKSQLGFIPYSCPSPGYHTTCSLLLNTSPTTHPLPPLPQASPT